jgi:hypothetical protein
LEGDVTEFPFYSQELEHELDFEDDLGKYIYNRGVVRKAVSRRKKREVFNDSVAV